jgi:hypothetical protein
MDGVASQVRGGVPGHNINQTEGFGPYVQGGYFIFDWNLQPWANYEYWNATDGFGSWSAYRTGLTYFLKGHNANIKLGYEHMQAQHDIGISRTENSGKDSIHTVMLGIFLYY